MLLDTVPLVEEGNPTLALLNSKLEEVDDAELG